MNWQPKPKSFCDPFINKAVYISSLNHKKINQEIEYALNAGKPLIPIVEKGVNVNELVALQGKEYIEYDPPQYQNALIKTASFVKSLKLNKQKQRKALLVAGGILAFFLLLSSRGEK